MAHPFADDVRVEAVGFAGDFPVLVVFAAVAWGSSGLGARAACVGAAGAGDDCSLLGAGAGAAAGAGDVAVAGADTRGGGGLLAGLLPQHAMDARR